MVLLLAFESEQDEGQLTESVALASSNFLCGQDCGLPTRIG